MALCFLSSIVAGRVKPQEYEDVAYYTVLIIDNVIETMKYPFKHVEETAKRRRSIGVGITNMAHYLANNGLTYTSQEGKRLMHEHAEQHYYWLARASLRIAKEKGIAEWMDKTKWPEGWLPIDTYNTNVDNVCDFKLKFDWESLRQDIISYGGIRNSVLVATAPSESSSLVSDTTNSIYPVRDLMLFKQSQKGNVLFFAPDYNKLKNAYQTAWEVPSKDVAEMYAIFSKFCDQGISADNWVDLSGEKQLELPEQIRYILLAAKLGVKSLYYLNSRTKSSDSIATQTDESECEACKL